MPRLQDLLFGIFIVALVALLMFGVSVGVLALVGAFGCGAFYVLVSMWPAQSEPLGQRLFTAVFLSSVVSCLVLILPGTLGVTEAQMEKVVPVIAALPPLAAACFEVLRTPRLIDVVLRGLSRVLGGR